MATQTPNYNLVKPASTDNVNIADLNGNADIIDAQIAELQEQIGAVSGTYSALTAGTYVADCDCYIRLVGHASESTSTQAHVLVGGAIMARLGGGNTNVVNTFLKKGTTYQVVIGGTYLSAGILRLS